MGRVWFVAFMPPSSSWCMWYALLPGYDHRPTERRTRSPVAAADMPGLATHGVVVGAPVRETQTQQDGDETGKRVPQAEVDVPLGVGVLPEEEVEANGEAGPHAMEREHPEQPRAPAERVPRSAGNVGGVQLIQDHRGVLLGSGELGTVVRTLFRTHPQQPYDTRHQDGEEDNEQDGGRAVHCNGHTWCKPIEDQRCDEVGPA